MNAPLASARVPAERNAPPRELEIRPKQVKAWIESLPLAQSVDAARKMSTHLAALNRAKIAPEDPEAKATGVDAYIEPLLLSLVDPYRLPPGELDKIVTQIRGLRGLATLGKTRPATKPGGHFIVPCDTDRGPKPLLSANDDTG